MAKVRLLAPGRNLHEFISQRNGLCPLEIFKEAIQAAGLTKVVCAGGSSDDVEVFLKRLHDQGFSYY